MKRRRRGIGWRARLSLHGGLGDGDPWSLWRRSSRTGFARASPRQQVSRATSPPLKPDSISPTVSALFKRLKIPKPKGVAVHLLRHTMASQMLESGASLPAVSDRHGDSSIRVTAEIYSHAIHGQDDEAVRRLEEYQRRQRQVQPENWKGSVQ